MVSVPILGEVDADSIEIRKTINDGLTQLLQQDDKISAFFHDPPRNCVHIIALSPEARRASDLVPHLRSVPKEYLHLVMSADSRGSLSGNDLLNSGIIMERDPNNDVRAFEKFLLRERNCPVGEQMHALVEIAENVSTTAFPLPESDLSSSALNVFPDSDRTGPSNRNDTALSERKNRTKSATQVNPEAESARYTNVAERLHLLQLLHYDFSPADLPDTDPIPGQQFTQDMADAAIFHPLSFGLRKLGPMYLRFKFAHDSWPFGILIQTTSGTNGEGELYSYRPKSDFLCMFGLLPWLIAKVESDDASAEVSLLLFQAAFIVRFANKHLAKYRENKNFRLVVVYIMALGVAKQWTVYQDKDDDKVKYTAGQVFTLTSRSGLVRFVRGLYNLASLAASESDDDTRDAYYNSLLLAKRLNEVEANPFVKGWVVTHPWTRSDDGTDEDLSSSSQRNSTANDDDTFDKQLECRGYRVEPIVFKDTLGGVWEEPNPPPPSKLRTVFKRPDVAKTRPLIAKRIRNSLSHELEILQYLHDQRPLSPYIITLIDHFTLGETAYLIFPKMARIWHESLCNGAVKEPCQSLVRGVAYLHANGVAHLDLKPDNLLYIEGTGQLQIIDFGIAMCVKDEDQEIEGFCGTKGWTAPEIGFEGGPTRSYSPIRADRWACGRILEGFLKYDSSNPGHGFEALSKQLMATNPKERPSLVGWRDPFLLQTSDSGSWAPIVTIRRREHDFGTPPLAKRPR